MVRFRSAIVLIVGLFLANALYAYDHEPEGFRGIKWGTEISAVKDMTKTRVPDAGGTDMYIKKNDNLNIEGAAYAESIEYGFWKGKFSCVLIRIKGASNWRVVKDTAFAKHGKGADLSGYIEKYIWSGDKTDIILEYDTTNEMGMMYMFSDKTFKQQEQQAK